MRDVWFIHIPKCGGTSIKEALDIDTGHQTLKSMKDSMDEKHWRESFSFAFIRNPLDRISSLYTFLKVYNGYDSDDYSNFRNWFHRTLVEEEGAYKSVPQHFAPCFDWVSLDGKSVHVDFVGKLEEIDRDFQNLCNILDVDASLKKLNSSSSREDMSYTPDMLTVMEKRFERDFELWYPDALN